MIKMKGIPSMFLKSLGARYLNQAVPIKDKSIGIIGIGMVGNAVTKNLQRNNYNVTSILDTDKMKCKPFSCEIARSPRELTSKVDIIITALPKPPNIKEVFEGPDGILAGMSPDKIWIDHSTTDYEQTMTFAAKVAEKNGHLLEAPVTGGLEALKKEQMTVLLAGEKSVYEYVLPLMSSVYQKVLYTGPMGTALIPKAISNTFAAMTCIAASEALIICKRAGIDVKTAFDIIRASTGNSFVWETAVPMIAQGNYDPSFSLDLHCKDNQLVFESAKRHGVPIELMGHVQQIFNRAMCVYGAEAPCYIPAKLLEDALNEPLQSDAFKNWSYGIEDIDGSAVIRHEGIDLVKTGHPLPKQPGQ